MEDFPTRVLVVEDEFLLNAMIADVLAEHGFEVHAVADAADALDHLMSGAGCDILFTDINLPGGVDGVELARRVRALRPDLPVVYCSGSVRRLEQIAAVAGATFVPKPYDPDKVCTMLGKLAHAPMAATA